MTLLVYLHRVKIQGLSQQRLMLFDKIFEVGHLEMCIEGRAIRPWFPDKECPRIVEILMDDELNAAVLTAGRLDHGQCRLAQGISFSGNGFKGGDNFDYYRYSNSALSAQSRAYLIAKLSL